jgi:hypothetical protein
VPLISSRVTDLFIKRHEAPKPETTNIGLEAKGQPENHTRNGRGRCETTLETSEKTYNSLIKK